jgi:hypothetical protein
MRKLKMIAPPAMAMMRGGPENSMSDILERNLIVFSSIMCIWFY